jgi:conjugal transfer pilus assembly protein TraI
MRALSNLLSFGRRHRPPPGQSGAPRLPARGDETPGEGLPAIPLAEVVALQRDLVERIAIAAGLDASGFEAVFMPPVQNLAAFLHLLPLPRRPHHAGPGGALRFALETAHGALQCSEGIVPTSAGSLRPRREVEPRWRFAAFVAALCRNLHVVAHEIIACDAGGTLQWYPYEKSLLDWASDHGLERYFFRMRPSGAGDAPRLGNIFLARNILPAASVQYILDAGPSLWDSLLSAVGGVEKKSTGLFLDAIMATAEQRAIERDLHAGLREQHQGVRAAPTRLGA